MYIIDYMGFIRRMADNDVKELSADAVFDALEPVIDELEQWLKQLTLEYVRSKTYPRYYHTVRSTLNDLKATWEYLQNDDAETYAVGYDFTQAYERFEQDMDDLNTVLHAGAVLSSNVYVPSTVSELSHSMTLSVENGATIETHTTECPAYKSITCRMKGPYTISVDTAQHIALKRKAYKLNSRCRFFVCKGCGEVSTSFKDFDASMTERGLKPVQRCRNCRSERRAKAEQEKLQNAEQEKLQNADIATTDVTEGTVHD